VRDMPPDTSEGTLGGDTRTLACCAKTRYLASLERHTREPSLTGDVQGRQGLTRPRTCVLRPARRAPPNTWRSFLQSARTIRRQRLGYLAARMHPTGSATALTRQPLSEHSLGKIRAGDLRRAGGPTYRLTPTASAPACGGATRSESMGSCRAEAGPWLIEPTQQDHLKREVDVFRHPKPRFLTEERPIRKRLLNQGRATSLPRNERVLVDPPLQRSGSSAGSVRC